MYIAIKLKILQAVNEKYFKEALYRLQCKHLHCFAEQLLGSSAITKLLKMVLELVLQMLAYLGSLGKMVPKLFSLTEYLTLNLISSDGSFRINIGKGLF
jgi:hypothetical protein